MKMKNVPYKILIVFLLYCITSLCFGTIQAKRLSKAIHRIPHITSKVKIDGVLNENFWKEAIQLDLKYEVEPGENINPPVGTEVLLAYAYDHLYVAFRAFDPVPSQIRARYTDRDKIWNDDYVGIVLDTFNDTRLTYNFYCNPLGIQAEKVININGNEIQWDAIWNSAGSITQEGYIVEMEIPFSALRFQQKKEEQVWGIDIVRHYPRNFSHLIGLFPRDRDNNCYICQAEKIIGFRNSRPGKNIELDPTFSATITQERENFPVGKFSTKTRRFDPGLTGRWRFTPNLTLSSTVNPDFSQVEADVAQLDVNNQFVLFYPEKRPFFLEDAGLFQSFYNVIYTRRFSDPDWGVKLTGKSGNHSIGFFSGRDNHTVFIFPWSQGSCSAQIDMENYSSAFRYRCDVGKSSTIGVVVTDREGDDYYNRLTGIDGRLQFSTKDLFAFQWLHSWSHYPEQLAFEYDQPQGNMQGNASVFHYRHTTQRYGLYLEYQQISPDYRADMGTNSQVDFKFFYGTLRYTLRRNPGHWFSTVNFLATYETETDTENTFNYNALKLELNYSGPLQSFVNILSNIGNRSFMGNRFTENYISIGAGIRPSGNFYAGFNGIFGDRIDYANVRAGHRIHLNPGIEYKWGRHFTFGIDHVFERLNVQEGRLYTANLSNLKVIYQFNRRTFLRTILQYANFNYNSGLYIFEMDSKFKHLFSQILFSYKINAQTVLFIGYSDDYYGYRDISVKQNNRTLFLKIGYALVL